MTDNGTGLTRSVAFYPGGDCPKLRSARVPRRERPYAEYDPRLLSYAEAARLLAVRAEAQRGQDESQAEVAAAMNAVAAAEVTAVQRIDRLAAFVADGKLADAHAAVRGVRERHLADGPESRRYRPKWWTAALWTTIVLAAVYDTAFLADMFLLTLDADWVWTAPTTYFAMIPGVLIAVALVVCGHFAAEAFRRSRAHVERKPTLARWPWGRGERSRSAEDMPWPRWGMSITALLLVLTTLGVWAGIRGQVAVADDGQDLEMPHWPMAMLVLLFSLTAVGMKVLHHNPYLDRAKETETDLATARAEADGLVGSMREGLAAYRSAVERLRALGERIRGRAQQALAAAVVAIMNERHEHGLAGDTATVVDDQPHGQVPAWVLRDLIEPYVPTDVPDRITAFLKRYDPEALRERWQAVMRELRDGTRPGGPGPGEHQENGW